MTTQLGSGWVWLAKSTDGKRSTESPSNTAW